MLIDHLLVAPPAYRTTWLEPVALLSALAGVTRTMRLGTLVLVLPFRDPVAFAKEWATLDVLSGGRSILGVGVGWNEGEFAALRIPYRERGRRMNEMLEAITALWAGDHVTYEGQYYQFDDLSLEPKPAQRPHPPIWIGGGTQPSEKIYGQDGRHDPPGPAPDREVRLDLGPALLRHRRDGRRGLGHHPRGHGRIRARPRRDDQGLLELHPCPRARARRPRARRREVPGLLGHGPRRTGRSSTCWARPRPLAERIRGKIEALGGVDHLILNPLDWDPETLERLASDVLPLIRGLTGGPMGELPAADDPRRRRSARARRTATAARSFAGGDGHLSGAGRPPGRRRRPRPDRAAGASRHQPSTTAWRIPALATWTDLVAGRPAAARSTACKAAARAVGGVQIQNRGTVAGNLVQRLAGGRRHAEPDRARCASWSWRRPRRAARGPGRRVRRPATAARPARRTSS